MKAIVALIAMVAGLAPANGQGTVNFANTGTFATSADRNVYIGTVGGSIKLTGTNYAAALYFGVTPDNVTHLAVRSEDDQTLLSAIGRFRAVEPDSSAAGTWSGGVRVLPGTMVGQQVYLEVRVWDINLFATFEEATAAGSPHGMSEAFLYMIPSAQDAPGMKMDGFRAFAFSVPEPSVLVLANVGVGILLFTRLKLKRKRGLG